MYRQFDGVIVTYKPRDMTTYRRLLPRVFGLPRQPLVRVFVIDYFQMGPGTLRPYQEAAVFLLATYKGGEAWHCITMPVTTRAAKWGGIIFLGYPKVLADVSLKRGRTTYVGTLSLQGRTIMRIGLDTTGHTVTSGERKWFKRLTGIRSLNILNGRVVDPLPAMGRQKMSLLRLAAMFPDKLTVKIGRARLDLNPKPARGRQGWRPGAFSLEPAEIVLAYYFKNKFGFSFGRVKVLSK